jgi:SNF2 family DNA or RNA helicase
LITASGKLVALDSLLAFMHARKHRVLIFSQMTAVLDILQDYLTFKGVCLIANRLGHRRAGYSYERLDGSVRSEERFASMRRFNENSQADVDGSAAFVFLLSTRAGGLGITLTGADTVIFYDSDFNPQNDLQAAARAHRIGQDKSVVMIPLMQGIIYRPVKIVRLIARHTVEEVIAMRAERKLRLTNAITGEGETGWACATFQHC